MTFGFAAIARVELMSSDTVHTVRVGSRGRTSVATMAHNGTFPAQLFIVLFHADPRNFVEHEIEHALLVGDSLVDCLDPWWHVDALHETVMKGNISMHQTSV